MGAEGKEARWCTLARGYILAADPTLLPHLILVGQIDDIIRHNSGLPPSIREEPLTFRLAPRISSIPRLVHLLLPPPLLSSSITNKPHFRPILCMYLFTCFSFPPTEIFIRRFVSAQVQRVIVLEQSRSYPRERFPVL